jgi:uncharacterized protein YunC (DUF1805 family)
VRREGEGMGGENTMRSQAIPLTHGEATGYVLDLGNAPLLIITTHNGYLMCGYLNIAAANKIGDVAGRVTGVRTLEEILNAKIIEVSDKARQKGLKEGMTGKEFLNALL